MVLACWGAASGWTLSQSSRLRLFPSGVEANRPPWDPSVLQEPYLAALPAAAYITDSILPATSSSPPAPRPARRKGSHWPLASTSCVALNTLFWLHVLFAMKQIYWRKWTGFCFYKYCVRYINSSTIRVTQLFRECLGFISAVILSASCFKPLLGFLLLNLFSFAVIYRAIYSALLAAEPLETHHTKVLQWVTYGSCLQFLLM